MRSVCVNEINLFFLNRRSFLWTYFHRKNPIVFRMNWNRLLATKNNDNHYRTITETWISKVLFHFVMSAWIFGRWAELTITIESIFFVLTVWNANSRFHRSRSLLSSNRMVSKIQYCGCLKSPFLCIAHSFWFFGQRNHETDIAMDETHQHTGSARSNARYTDFSEETRTIHMFLLAQKNILS